MSSLSDSLLDMYSSAHSLSASDFGARIFEWLHGFVPFDSAAIGEVAYSPKGVSYRAAHLHRQPVEKVVAYAGVAHLDTAAAAMARNAGRVVSCAISDALPRAPSNEPMRRYVREFGVEQCLDYCVSDGASGEAMALWRGSKAAPYKVGEVGAAQIVAPHALLALRLNSSRFLQTDAGRRAGHASLVARADGAVGAFDEQAERLLRSEWPGWEPPRLPAQLLAALSSFEARYVGRCLIATRSMSGEAMVVRLRPRDPRVASLTPAQARVAAALARGDSYKRVAADMGLSPATVRNHAHAIYRRLGARSRADLARMAASEAERAA